MDFLQLFIYFSQTELLLFLLFFGFFFEVSEALEVFFLVAQGEGLIAEGEGLLLLERQEFLFFELFLSELLFKF
ncbi:MAG: hypothetical protein IPH31_16230 [Lewinellaceae bacterium]|nr:hypothetical protein [Lewinellaceae bacterium]